MDENEFAKSLDDNRPVYEYRVLSARDALADQPPMQWVIEQLITAGSVSVFYGAPGSKKTWTLLSLAVHVALGKSWLGFNTVPVKVLVIDEESGERRFMRRLNAALHGALADEDAPIEFVCLAGFRLDNKHDAEEIERLIAERQAGLVILDALADIMGGDENSKQDAQPVFTALRRIADKTEAAIIVIHHSNRQGNYRGSSAIPGSVDLMLKIESENASQWVYFSSEKERDIERVTFTGVAYWTEDQFYMQEAENIKKNKPLSRGEKYAIRYLQEHGESGLPDIMAAADSTTPGGAKQGIYSLVEKGIAYRTNPDESGRGVVARYDLQKELEDGVNN